MREHARCEACAIDSSLDLALDAEVVEMGGAPAQRFAMGP